MRGPGRRGLVIHPAHHDSWPCCSFVSPYSTVRYCTVHTVSTHRTGTGTLLLHVQLFFLTDSISPGREKRGEGEREGGGRVAVASRLSAPASQDSREYSISSLHPSPVTLGPDDAR